MRKKSHISLARYIVNNMEDNDLKKHKLSFYIGSVLPDIKPSFVYKRHEMDGTYPDIRRHIERLSQAETGGEEKRQQVLHGSWTDQPLSGRLFYLSSQ